ncbi:MAG: hypothetical protein BWZ10_00148 [candidate division BRC1 bacterium ADurb.BinA364]|nr:MAG: hypothetical protein BWZ10_00148 [candidate division BRC1 bacterium ADurb.BinA364]
MLSVTTGLPCVNVPVLSKAKTRIRASASRQRPPLISTPREAALAMALTRLTGTLTTSAQGQAITSICSARIIQPCGPRNGC